MTVTERSFRRLIITTLAFLGIFTSTLASDIVSISPITNKIILIVFDDGTVIYPNDLQVSRLVIGDAMTPSNYSISSSDDPDVVSAIHPSDIGRKSKGTEFVKDAPWGGSSYDPRSKPWASKHFIYLFFENELKSGKSYTIHTSALAENGSDWDLVFDEKELRSESVHVNTIGYETNAPKYGYVYQWMGDRGGLDLTSYNGKSFHVYKDGSDVPVLSGLLKKRKSATNKETSQAADTPNSNFLGAEVYECDFSTVNEDGTYVLVVDDMGCSYPFKIGEDALWDAYYTVGRALFYQRSGIRLAPPYTDGDYVRPVTQNTHVSSDDGTDFAGLLLYSDLPYSQWTAEDGGTAKQAIKDAAIGHPLDVAGWYHDAGDWDAYYTHQRIPILLMLTYEYFPERFADGDLNLPESGNGIPDLVDEASWLIKFNYRLRKELMAKGYSDGGVGGARICPDVFSSEDGNAEGNNPSWKDYRRYVVSKADAFMTYLYAGQAAQFAIILKKLGKDPHNFPVEMLDAVDFASMSEDIVDWEQEAKDAYTWASASENQPENNNNYGVRPGIYQMYAAANLYRLTNEEQYHTAAKAELETLKNANNLGDDERYGVYSYLLADNYSKDNTLNAALLKSAINTANYRAVDASELRACRWGGVYSMPMLVGQATTPWVFEAMIAYGLSGDKKFLDVAHTTADYFLGTNPLHSTWATGLGPRPAEAGFHLDSRYCNNWVNYPGFIPYGPWSMAYGFDPITWTIDGVVYKGGAGPWNKDWANFSQYPMMNDWPGHERWNSNIHAPLSTENTIHQNAVYGMLTYGFVNNHHNTNSGASKEISNITLDKTELTISTPEGLETLHASIDISNAGFGALKWRSSDKRVAHVDQAGRVTGVTSGICTITCSTLDGSVSASCDVTCSWAEVDVTSISVVPDSLQLVEGQTSLLEVFFSPDDATNTFADWSFSAEGIAEIDENRILKALAPGDVFVIARSLNGSKKDTCVLKVVEAADFLIADFDSVVPVKTEPQPDFSQIYTPSGGSSDIASDNPLISLSNESSKTLKFSRAAGNWQLIGMVLPTDNIQSSDKYAQFQFKYYGRDISDLFIQLAPVEGENFEKRIGIEGIDAWRLFTMDLNASFDLKQFNVFVNPEISSEMSCLFDDFKLAAEAAHWYDGLSLSDTDIEIKSKEKYVLIAEADGNPYSWVSEDTAVATIDQNGTVEGIAKGTTKIWVVPLYGDAVECIVNVDGGVFIEPETYETNILLDFESIELDGSGPYNAHAWDSDEWSKTDNPVKENMNQSDKIFSWKRDGVNPEAGFSIQFPTANTSEWSRLSFMVYSESEISELCISLKDGENELGATVKNINMLPYCWNQVVVNLEDFNLSDPEFNTIVMLVGDGTYDTFTVYLDNVWIERGTTIPANGIYILDDSPIEIQKDSLYQLTALSTPANTSDSIIQWDTSLSGVATVSESGLVEGVGGGSVSISASIMGSPSIHASVLFNVIVKVSAVIIDGESEVFLMTDSTIQLITSVSPVDATEKSLNWESRDTTIVTVSETGLLTGISEGSTIVTATSLSNQEASDSVFVNVTSTGVGLYNISNIQVYPNPANNYFILKAGSPINRIELIHMTSKRTLKISGNGQDELLIKNAHFTSGLYLIKVQLENGQLKVAKILID